MAFRVGQKVVCVDAGPSIFTGLPTVVELRRIYTVKKSWTDAIFNHPVVLLQEVDPPKRSNSFNADRFRPVVERKTDISIFTAMLTPSKRSVEA